MGQAVCQAEDILRLNETKEYTLTATPLLEALLKDCDLIHGSAKLWQLLYNKARFEKTLTVVVSCRSLSIELGKSIKTVRRYIANLVEYGYLLKQFRYEPGVGQVCSKYALRFPEHFINEFTQLKNRQKENAMQENILIYPQGKNDQGSMDTTVPPNNSNNCYTNNNTQTSAKKSTSTSLEIASVVEKNNVEEATEEKVGDLKTTLKQQLSEAKLQLDVIHKSTMDSAGKYQAISAQNATITQLERKLEGVQTPQSANLDEGDLPFCKKRIFTQEHIDRLKQGVAPFVTPSKPLDVLINEITYAIRFGSLQKSAKTKDPISIDHGINIALKLLRDNRWATPLDMREGQHVTTVSHTQRVGASRSLSTLSIRNFI